MWFCLFYVMISLIFYLHEVDGRRLTIQESLVHNTSNISHPKTIKTKYGDIYDCVELYKQPAFQHPLFKHHKIKMRKVFPEQNEVSDKGSPSNLRYGLKEGCPLGTVPIRRTTKEEQSLAKAIFRQHFEPSANLPNNQQDRFAGLVAGPIYYPSFGEGGAYISTHNPHVEKGQLSRSVISAEYTHPFETVRAGWMVYPDLYNGDNHTRLFTAWGVNNNETQEGCYNTYCSGFVQLSKNMPADIVIDPISVPAGEYSYIKIGLQIREDGSWELTYGENDELVGYWPNFLFAGLKGGAPVLSWGGWVSSVTPNLPMMGSGLLGNLGSMFRKITSDVFHDGSVATSMNGIGILRKTDFQISQSNCYRAGVNHYKGDYWGDSFWYGGNGGDVNQCPK